jgi:hypothetical protein
MRYSSKFWRIIVQRERQRTAELQDFRAFGPYVITDEADSMIASVSIGRALVCDFNGNYLAHEHLKYVKNKIEQLIQ